MPLQLFRRATAGSGSPGGSTESGLAGQDPHEICDRLNEDLDALAAAAEGESAGSVKTLSEDIRKELQLLLAVLEEAAEKGEKIRATTGTKTGSAGELLDQFLTADLPTRLVRCLGQLEFEVRKDVISVFSAIVRIAAQIGADQQLQQYAESHPQFFEELVAGYEKPEIATHCGMMLRSCARQSRLVEAFLSQTQVSLKLISFTRHESFDISTDAFATLHDFLLTHHALSAKFLEANFKEFFTVYNSLLQTGDYVTQRQALKLLSDMLLERKFMRVMMAYIEDEQFLQIHMNLLRADSKAIQLEAFHVFKIFVANPQKPLRVQQILYKNKDRLVKLLEDLKANRTDDKQFDEDKSTVIGKLQAMEQPSRPAPSGYVRDSNVDLPTANPP